MGSSTKHPLPRLLEEGLGAGTVVCCYRCRGSLDGFSLGEVKRVPRLPVLLAALLVVLGHRCFPEFVFLVGILALLCPPFDELVQLALYPLDVLDVHITTSFTSFTDSSETQSKREHHIILQKSQASTREDIKNTAAPIQAVEASPSRMLSTRTQALAAVNPPRATSNTRTKALYAAL
jgi:hypothetical protein